MTAHHAVDRTEDRSPSQVTDDFWVCARRQHGRSQEPTERSGKGLLFVPKEKMDKAWARHPWLYSWPSSPHSSGAPQVLTTPGCP